MEELKSQEELMWELMKIIFPEDLFEYFNLAGMEEVDGAMHIKFEEKNIVPLEHAGRRLKSKGFYTTKLIQDYPVRGKPGYLRIKRRQWIDQDTGERVSRDWNLVAKGSKLTKEFADFLKALDRD